MGRRFLDEATQHLITRQIKLCLTGWERVGLAPAWVGVIPAQMVVGLVFRLEGTVAGGVFTPVPGVLRCIAVLQDVEPLILADLDEMAFAVGAHSFPLACGSTSGEARPRGVDEEVFYAGHRRAALEQVPHARHRKSQEQRSALRNPAQSLGKRMISFCAEWVLPAAALLQP